MNKQSIVLETETFVSVAKYVVILTSYGRDALLRRAITSVLDQKYQDFILLVIDDNSPEVNTRTQDVIREFASNQRLLFFRTLTSPAERQSVSTFCRNINFLLDMLVSGSMLQAQYVCYLPCDDYFLPDKLLEVDKFFINNPLAKCCYHGINLQDIGGKVLTQVPVIGFRKPVAQAVSHLDHGCVVHQVQALKLLTRPYWSLSKTTEHQAPDGDFFNKLISVTGSIPPVGKILGVKLKNPQGIQGKKYGWR